MTPGKSCCRPQSPISKYHFNYYSLSSAPLSTSCTPPPEKKNSHQPVLRCSRERRYLTPLCAHIWISRELCKLGGCDVTVRWKYGSFVVVRVFPSPSSPKDWSSASTLVMRIAGADGFSACTSNSTVVVASIIQISGPGHHIWKELTVLYQVSNTGFFSLTKVKTSYQNFLLTNWCTRV